MKLRARLAPSPASRPQSKSSPIALSADGRYVARIVGTTLHVWDLTSPAASPRTAGDVTGAALAARPEGGFFIHGMGGWLDAYDADLRPLPKVPLIVLTASTRIQGGRLFATHRVLPTADAEMVVLVASETSNHHFGRSLLVGWVLTDEGHRWMLDQVETASLSVDGATAAVVRGGSVTLIDARTGAACGPVELAGKARRAAPRSDRRGAFVLAEHQDEHGERGGYALLGVSDDRTTELVGSLGFVHRDTQIALSPDESLLAATGSADEVALFDVERGERVAAPSLGDRRDGPASLLFTPDGALLVGVADGGVLVFDLGRPLAPSGPRAGASAHAAELPRVRSGQSIVEEDARQRLSGVLSRMHDAGLLLDLDRDGLEEVIETSGHKLADFSTTYIAATLGAALGVGATESALRQGVVTVRRGRSEAHIREALHALLAVTSLDAPPPVFHGTQVVLGDEAIECRYGFQDLGAWCNARLSAANRAQRVFLHGADMKWIAFALRVPESPEAESLGKLMFDLACAE